MGQYDWLADLPEGTVYTVFDTETTGLDAATNRVVEIGALRFDQYGIAARFSTLINPQRPMPAEASRVNGITDAMLADKPLMADVLPDFLAFAGDSILIAHNAPFDISFMNSELGRNGLAPLKNRVVDTRIFAKDIFPGLPKYALQELASRFGIQALDAHRAEDDARVCMQLFNVCLERLMAAKPKTAPQNAAADLFAAVAQSAPPVKADPIQDLFDDGEDEIFSDIDEDWDEEAEI